MSRQIAIESESASVVIDLDQGCRLASFRALGHELLLTEGVGPIDWGCYPMAPWAGRLRDGRFEFDGTQHQMPPNLGQHAIHGTVFTKSWSEESPGVFITHLGPPWPFAGLVRQRVDLAEDHLSLTLEVHSDEVAMPAACGWHPWFRRFLGPVEGHLVLEAGFMELRDKAGIPSGERVPPSPGPWDDCFGGLARPPLVVWPGILSLRIDSNCDYVVVFDEQAATFCVEPQTAPPDSLNQRPHVVRPREPLVATTSWTWARDR